MEALPKSSNGSGLVATGVRRPGYRWRVIACGLDAPVVEQLAAVCEKSAVLSFEFSTRCLATLASALESQAVDLLVVDALLVAVEPIGALRPIHQLAPAAVSIVLGTGIGAQELSSCVDLGLRGLIERERVGPDLRRALEAVVAGELWLSRQRMAALLMMRHTDHMNSDMPTHGRIEDDLTEREKLVLYQATLGRSNKDIGRMLQISPQTVKIHMQHIYRKLHVHRRADLMLRQLTHRDSQDAAGRARSHDPPV